ncbi:MAG: response regulator [Alteromonadaceae bacterium]|nr:response regulator [Alteromonadaceae bacterium]
MSLSDCNVLIVDDIEENVRILSEILETQGIQTRATTSPKMALQSAKASPPDLVLLDVRMPEMDGFTVCQELKSFPATASVPVIFISGSVDSVDRDRGAEVGGVDYINKPFRLKDVIDRVTAHLV